MRLEAKDHLNLKPWYGDKSVSVKVIHKNALGGNGMTKMGERQSRRARKAIS